MRERSADERLPEEYAALFAEAAAMCAPETAEYTALIEGYSLAVLTYATEVDAPRTGEVLNSLFNQGMEWAAQKKGRALGYMSTAAMTTEAWHRRERTLVARAQLPVGYTSAQWTARRYLGWLANTLGATP